MVLGGDGTAAFPLFQHFLVMEQLIPAVPTLSGDGTADFPLFHHQDPQDTCSKNPGASFSEVAEAPQAAATQTHTAGGS